MTVRIEKPAINVREELADLRKPSGVAGEAMLRAETPQEQFNLIGAGRRNLIINGDMRIAQRGTSVTGTSVAGYKTVDRWSLSLDGDNDNLVVDIAQTGDAPDGFSKSHKITVATPETAIEGDEQVSITQAIEAQDLAALAYGSSSAKEMTLSFWVKSSIAANYAVQFYTEDSNNQFVSPYTINSANTWEYKTIVVPPLTGSTITLDNNVGLLIYWGLSAGPDRTTGTGNTSSWGTWNKANTFSGMTGNWMATSGATFQITGVQLELGKVATPFEHRSYGEELAACQRYYESYNGSASAGYMPMGIAWTTNEPRFDIRYLEKRVAPTISLQSGSTLKSYNAGSGTEHTWSNFNVDDATTKTALIYGNNSMAATQGYAVQTRLIGNILIDAEL